MILEKSDRFKDELERIVDYIALDSVARALAFFDAIIVKINAIPDNPYIYRKRSSLQASTLFASISNIVLYFLLKMAMLMML